LYFWVKNGGSGDSSYVSNFSSLVNVDEWHMLTVVYDGTQAVNNDRMKIFLDGDSTNIITNFGASIATSTGNTDQTLELGEWAGNYYEGNLDEFAIWDSALTTSQISSLYNNGYPKDLTALSPKQWWRLGEDAWFDGSDFIIPNKIAGGLNGASSNMDLSNLVADAPGSYASGVGSSLVVGDRVGDAPESTANSLSTNMTPLNKISYPAGYVPTQVDNVDSMAFDGLSDYVLTGLTPASYTGFSISAWVYANSLGAFNVVASQYRNSDPANSAWFLETIGSTMAFGVGSGSSVLYATKAFSTSGWYHITGVWNGSTVEVYIDGVASGSPVSATSMNTGTVDMAIGALWDSGGASPSLGFWNGKIDEVAIFDYALSERQIKQDIYEGTTTDKTADLNNISNLTAPVAWYRMGD